ncbi:MAG: RecQ family ATP-dependent DNA helicase [Treponema sp.]|jgi:ATP-dependent DNA helicase RecQ|nr:RecQ family ATP-dependent DNA helicase [Treponema sp.]
MQIEKTIAPLTDDPLTNAVEKLFGLSYLFPYQRLVIANILEAAEAEGIKIRWPGEPEVPREADASGAKNEGFDPEAVDPDTDLDASPSDRESSGRQIVILPTGAGKSLCFQLPAMLMEGPTLVIYPLLGLMSDQERRLAERGFSPVIIRGSQTKEERESIWKKLRSGESKFIIANPEVLLTPSVMARLKEIKIIHIVIDEAHCVSEWGESFRPSYLEINKIIKAAAAPMVTAFTATAGASVLEKIDKHIFGGGSRRIVGNPDRKNISYASRGCILRNLAVRDLVLANSRPAIVFCSSRPGTEKLARYLREEMAERRLPWQKEIRFYHAGLSREEKKETELWFLQNRGAVLTATCAYGLGIDKPDIRTVIHRDCPPSVEAYLQESGRAGRDGKQSRAILLWGPEDERSLQRAKTGEDGKRIGRLLTYARDASRCRREALLEMLDYEGEKDCPGSRCCDVCENEASTGLREERSLEDFFRRNRRCYTANEAAGLLAGAANIHWSEEEAAEAINHLIKTGKLRKLKNPLWKNKITFVRRNLNSV